MIFDRIDRYSWTSKEGYRINAMRFCKNKCIGICQCGTYKFTAWSPRNEIIGCYSEAEDARQACRDHLEEKTFDQSISASE